MKGSFYYFISFGLLFFSLFSINSIRAQNVQSDVLSTQAQIMSGLSLELQGGVNQRGRRTLLAGGIVDFGNISFVNPDVTTNGDAYFVDRNLWLEATIEAKVIFNGGTSVDVTISQIVSGANAFERVMYSTGLRQQDETVLIPIQPDSQLIGTVNNSGDTKAFRLIGVVTPLQTGLLSAKVQIGAQKI